MNTPHTPEKSPPLSALQTIALKRKLLEAKILSRAWEDEPFCELLKSDPTTALKEAGIEVEESWKIVVREEAPSSFEIVLPPQPTDSHLLSENELEAVAGGGLLGDGTCKHYEKIEQSESTSRKTVLTASAVAGALFGLSWGWG